jgi:hypothetical protein
MAGISAFKAIGDYQSHKSQIAGLRELKDVTPAERAYEKRRQEIMKTGDPLINQAGNEAIGVVRQQGQFNLQRATGQAINQGLENSIVAQELRRKVDADTLRGVAKQAREMALANAQAKRSAENELEAFNMNKDSRNRDIDARIAGMPSGPSSGEQLFNIASAGVGAFASAGGDFGIKSAMPWDDIDMDTLSSMSSADKTVFMESLTPKQQLQFLEYVK